MNDKISMPEGVMCPHPNCQKPFDTYRKIETITQSGITKDIFYECCTCSTRFGDPQKYLIRTTNLTPKEKEILDDSEHAGVDSH